MSVSAGSCALVTCCLLGHMTELTISPPKKSQKSGFCVLFPNFISVANLFQFSLILCRPNISVLAGFSLCTTDLPSLV